MGYALDSRPQHHEDLVNALIEEMRSDWPIFSWCLSSAGELFTSIPGYIVLLTGSSTIGESKLLVRLAGATSHSEIWLGSEEDRQLRELILATEPKQMDGDEWVCRMLISDIKFKGVEKRGA